MRRAPLGPAQPLEQRESAVDDAAYGAVGRNDVKEGRTHGGPDFNRVGGTESCKIDLIVT
jgi:hypothetical protein